MKTAARRNLYGRPGKTVSSSSSHFIPYRLHDVVFTSLRLVIFKIDPTSATPIAHHLRNDLNDAEIFKLLGDLQSGERGIESHPKGWIESRFQRCKALKEKMAEAKIKHAIHLRDEGAVDVDIIYSVPSYQVLPFKADKEKLEHLVSFVFDPLRFLNS